MWVGGNCSGPTRGVSPAPSSSLSGDPHIMSAPTFPGRDSEYLPPVFTPPQFPHPPELGTVI